MGYWKAGRGVVINECSEIYNCVQIYYFIGVVPRADTVVHI